MAVSFCGDRFRKISVCAGIRLLSASMNELPWMKNMTRRVGGTGCSAHVPSAPGVSLWKDTRCQCQIQGESCTTESEDFPSASVVWRMCSQQEEGIVTGQV